MTKQANEQVRHEKETGEKILRDTVEKVRVQGVKEKEEAVAVARKEEVEIARKETERVARSVMFIFVKKNCCWLFESNLF